MKKLLLLGLLSCSVMFGSESGDGAASLVANSTTTAVFPQSATDVEENRLLVEQQNQVAIPNEGALTSIMVGNEAALDILMQPKTVMTFGTFDLFHIGHLNILRHAKALANGGRLIVGVSSDAFNFSKKGKNPVISQEERLAIIQASKFVDTVFLEEAMEKKVDYLKEHHADILVMGDDWSGKFDNICDGVQSIYFPRTEDISTTDLIKKIRE